MPKLKKLKNLEVLHLILNDAADAERMFDNLKHLPKLKRIIINYSSYSLLDSNNKKESKEKYVTRIKKYLEQNPRVEYFEFESFSKEEKVDDLIVPQLHRFAIVNF